MGRLTIFPNPIEKFAHIQFELKFHYKVSLEIFDLQGRRATMLLNENLPAGFHKVTWNVEEFYAGIYFCKISAGEYSCSKLVFSTDS